MVAATRTSTTVEREKLLAQHPATLSSVPRGVSIVFYDGVCALCNGSVRFLRKRDPEQRYYFASLQSEFAQRALLPHSCEPDDLGTIYLLTRYGESDELVVSHSRAIFRILRSLGGFWWLVSALDVLPRGLLDFGYQLVVRNRYRVFGKYDACPLPSPEERHLFLDAPSPTDLRSTP